MKIHYDNIIYSLQKAGGISSYWSALISRFLRDQLDIHFTENPNENLSRKELHIPSHLITPSPSKRILVDRFKKIALPHQTEPFIFHSSYNRTTSNAKATSVITVHDFVHEKFYGGLRRYLHVLQKNKAIENARKIIVVSENTKQDLLHFHPYLSEDQVHVVYNGVSDDFFPLPEKPARGRSYLVFIGSRAYYKNFNFAVDVIQALPDFDLHIVGTALSKSEQKMLNEKIPGHWKIFTHIQNQELNSIYNDAFALIYPSSYEGFGIPLLEVMKTGTPFVALKQSSIPEVAGDAGILVDDLDVDSFRDAILSINGHEDVLRAKGIIQSNQFSWEKCYQETSAIYKALS
ncbi:glycosyltransferase family 1 protein [Pedobacter agri]|uniref:glycosyltransferase family 4 protein n=1 Tax=Pedobacter agri TaxID=454586 RepID=UPI00292DCFB7|nr:glycosyltransferase family 1 protein [Pedobacter agri]